LATKKTRFCELPWVYCEINSGGGWVYTCCPAFNFNGSIGNMFHDDPSEVWNSPKAQAIRKGILDQTFSECDKAKCPYLASDSLPTMEEAKNSIYGSYVADVIAEQNVVAKKGPLVVKLGYDPSCNLTCQSCRTKPIMAKRKDQKELDKIMDKFILPFLSQAQTLVLSSDGDPFASKHYRSILKITKKKLPNLMLGICTNGVLLNESAWNDCSLEGRVGTLLISVDAATEDTYKYLRRGGDF
jgi:MoaA/NifB/PqqE/SkfB family radical SAM enzyme